MQVNGYVIKETIKKFLLRKTVLDRLIPESFEQFKRDDESFEQDPVKLAEELDKVCYQIARLEHFRQEYNSNQKIKINGNPMTLSVAIKLFDTYSRIEGLFRNWAAPKADRYSSRYENKREEGTIYKYPVMTKQEALKKSEHYAALSADIRQQVAFANSNMVTVPEEYESLFQ